MNYEQYILASKNVSEQIQMLKEHIKELETELAYYKALNDMTEYKYVVI